MVLSQWVYADAAEIRIAYLHAAESKSRLSLVEIPANDDGLAGAQLAIKDNNTTGKFLNQQFSLEDTESQQGDDFVVAARTLAERGIELIIADLPADALLRAADGRPNLLFFNVGAADDRLREEDCRSDVIHVAPTRSMLLASVSRQLENFAGAMNFVIFPMFFASSALYPLWRVRESSPILYYVCQLNPFTHAVELARFALYGQINWVSLAVVCGCTALFMIGAILAFDPSRGLLGRRGET